MHTHIHTYIHTYTNISHRNSSNEILKPPPLAVSLYIKMDIHPDSASLRSSNSNPNLTLTSLQLGVLDGADEHRVLFEDRHGFLQPEDMCGGARSPRPYWYIKYLFSFLYT